MFWRSGRKSDQPEADLVVAVQPAPSAREKLTPYVDEVRERVDVTRERLTPYVQGAKGRVDIARERVTPYVEHTIDGTTARLAGAIATAGPARQEMQRRRAAALAALRGDVPEPAAEGRHWGRRFMFLGLLTGLGAAAFSFFKRRQDDDSWITADTPYPTYGGSESSDSAGSAGAGTYSSGMAAADASGTSEDAIGGMGVEQSGSIGNDLTGQATVETEDAGGAGPDEAAADSTDEPADPSTPDEPIERVTPKDVADQIQANHSHKDG